MVNSLRTIISSSIFSRTEEPVMKRFALACLAVALLAPSVEARPRLFSKARKSLAVKQVTKCRMVNGIRVCR